MTEYRIVAERTETGWSLQSVEWPGAMSQVPDLDDFETIREAISFVADIPESSIDVKIALPLRFRASTRPEGTMWLITVEGVSGATQARDLDEADLMAREFISTSTGIDLANMRVQLRHER